MNLAAGAVLQSGKYIVQSVSSQGDDLVYQSIHAVLNQTVILQTLSEEASADSEQQQQFLAAARQFAHCIHPHLVRLLDVFQEDSVPFAVLECVSGQTLADLVQASQPLSEAAAVRYIRQIASALQTLHRQGLVHQRVKPQNIVLKSETDEAVLTGFRIADQGRSPLIKFPETDSVPSTPTDEAAQAFSSPPPDPSTDIQALTVTLYYLLTGQHPATRTVDFVSLNQTTLDQSSLGALRQLHPQLSPGVEQAILKGLQPAHLRPQSISEWLDILDNLHPNPLILEPFESVESVSLPLEAAQTNGHSLEHALVDATAEDSQGDRAPASEPILPQFDDLAAGLTRVPAVVPRPIVPPPQPVPKPMRWLPAAMLVTAAIAGIGGAGLGLALRLDTPGSSNSSTTGFGRDQAFPPIEDWPGTDTYDFESDVDIPVERRPSASGDSTDYGIENFTPEYDPEYSPENDAEYNLETEPGPLPVEEPALTESEPPLKVEPLPESVESVEPLDIAPLPTEPAASPAPNLYPSVDSNRSPNVRSVSPPPAAIAPTPLPDPEPPVTVP